MHHGLNQLRRSPLSVRLAVLGGLLLAQAACHLLWPGLGIDWFLSTLAFVLSGMLLPLHWALPVGLTLGVAMAHGSTLAAVSIGHIFTAAGAGAVIIWLVHIVTDRLQFLQAVVDSTDEIVYVIDDQGRLFYINQSGADQLGYSPGEIIGTSFETHVPPWYREAGWALFRHVLATPGKSRNRIHVMNQQGQQLTFLVKNETFSRNDHTYVLGVAHDVTQPEWTEHLISVAFDAYTAPVAVRTTDGRIIRCNESFAQSVGRTKSDLVNTRLLPFGLPTDMPEAWVTTLSAGNSAHHEVLLADGRTVAIDLFPVSDDPGGIDSHILHVRDITERKAAQQRLLDTAKLAATGQMAAGVAHNINNILTAISVSADLLLLNPAGTSEQVSRDIQAAVQRGATMVRKLYGLAGGSTTPKLEPLAVETVFRSELQLLQPQLVAHGITSNIHAPKGIQLFADANLVHQILMNLIVNSIHAMPDGGTLTLTAASSDGAVELRVTDTGHGIPEEHLGRIFTPFFTTKGSVKGTGLGLPTSLTMAKAMGGDILVDSAPGKGSTFTLRFGPDSAEGSRNKNRVGEVNG